MYTLRARAALLALLASAGVAFDAGATILTFGYTGGTFAIPEDYGDRVTAVTDPDPLLAGWSYAEGNGFTPNVVVDYAPETGGFSVWPAGYGTLSNALGHSSFNVRGEIVLVPDPGYRVQLNGFELAGWNGVTYDTEIRIYDDTGDLFNVTMPIPGTGSTSPLGAPLLGKGPVHIYLDVYGSVGLDNLDFDQVVVPLPASAVLLAPALLALRRRTTI